MSLATKLTYDDLIKASKSMGEALNLPKALVLHQSLIEVLIGRQQVRVEENGRMFVCNYHQMPWLNGIEVFNSHLEDDSKAFVVDKVIFDDILGGYNENK